MEQPKSSRWGHGAHTVAKVLVYLTALVAAGTASAIDGWIRAPFTPLQVSLAGGTTQVFARATHVYGVRLSALYGSQSDVSGIDLGVLPDTDSLRGLGFGLINVTQENLYGVQLAIGNLAGSVSGLQLGLVNQAGALRGLQLGILNSNDSGFPIFPLFNVGWSKNEAVPLDAIGADSEDTVPSF